VAAQQAMLVAKVKEALDASFGARGSAGPRALAALRAQPMVNEEEEKAAAALKAAATATMAASAAASAGAASGGAAGAASRPAPGVTPGPSAVAAATIPTANAPLPSAVPLDTPASVDAASLGGTPGTQLVARWRGLPTGLAALAGASPAAMPSLTGAAHDGLSALATAAAGLVMRIIAGTAAAPDGTFSGGDIDGIGVATGSAATGAAGEAAGLPRDVVYHVAVAPAPAAALTLLDWLRDGHVRQRVDALQLYCDPVQVVNGDMRLEHCMWSHGRVHDEAVLRQLAAGGSVPDLPAVDDGTVLVHHRLVPDAAAPGGFSILLLMVTTSHPTVPLFKGLRRVAPGARIDAYLLRPTRGAAPSNESLRSCTVARVIAAPTVAFDAAETAFLHSAMRGSLAGIQDLATVLEAQGAHAAWSVLQPAAAGTAAAPAVTTSPVEPLDTVLARLTSRAAGIVPSQLVATLSAAAAASSVNVQAAIKALAAAIPAPAVPPARTGVASPLVAPPTRVYALRSPVAAVASTAVAAPTLVTAFVLAHPQLRVLTAADDAAAHHAERATSALSGSKARQPTRPAALLPVIAAAVAVLAALFAELGDGGADLADAPPPPLWRAPARRLHAAVGSVGVAFAVLLLAACLAAQLFGLVNAEPTASARVASGGSGVTDGRPLSGAPPSAAVKYRAGALLGWAGGEGDFGGSGAASVPPARIAALSHAHLTGSTQQRRAQPAGRDLVAALLRNPAPADRAMLKFTVPLQPVLGLLRALSTSAASLTHVSIPVVVAKAAVIGFLHAQAACGGPIESSDAVLLTPATSAPAGAAAAGVGGPSAADASGGWAPVASASSTGADSAFVAATVHDASGTTLVNAATAVRLAAAPHIVAAAQRAFAGGVAGSTMDSVLQAVGHMPDLRDATAAGLVQVAHAPAVVVMSAADMFGLRPTVLAGTPDGVDASLLDQFKPPVGSSLLLADDRTRACLHAAPVWLTLGALSHASGGGGWRMQCTAWIDQGQMPLSAWPEAERAMAAALAAADTLNDARLHWEAKA
jgi:hypothetical protein